MKEVSADTVPDRRRDPEIALNQDWADRAFSLQSAEVPFSFVYNGRQSGEFIGNWKREVQAEEMDGARQRRTLTLTDPETGLEVRAAVTTYTDSAGVDWTLTFTNTGTEDTPIIEQVRAVDTVAADDAGECPVLHRLRGSPCDEADWLPFDDPLPRGERIAFAPALGRSSNGASPFFCVTWAGGGVITAIGWSGQWSAAVAHGEDGRLRMEAGMECTHLSLHPGESVRSPRILQLYWESDDPWRGYNLFRRTMLGHVVPKVDGKTITPPIVHLSTSFYELNDSTEANVLSHLEPIKGLGFEMFWLDAYFTRDGFPKGMGNYGFPLERAIPPDRFPNGLRPIGDAAHEAGMGFLVWFEPERVADGTHIAREHPEWVMDAGDSSQHHLGSRLLNIGLPEARDYITKYLIAAIEAYGMDWLRIDYNIDPLPFWRSRDEEEPDRVGMAEIRYTEGLYKMWDDILAAHPHLSIDNCSSGGRRIDLETCSRSIPLWRTDATIQPLWDDNFNQAALQNHLMTAGLSRYVPFNVSGMMGTEPYHFRSGFNGGIAFCEDCRPADYPVDTLRQAIEEGKRIRKYYFGNFYPHSAVTTSPSDWCVLQYHRPDEQDGMVIAFRRHESPYASFACELRGIDPGGTYQVTQARGYAPSEPVEMAGADLQRLKLAIDDCPGSVIFEYRRCTC